MGESCLRHTRLADRNICNQLILKIHFRPGAKPGGVHNGTSLASIRTKVVKADLTEGRRDVPETVAAIVAAHRDGSASPAQTVARSFRRIREHNDPAIFISLRDEKEAIAEAEGLAGKDAASLALLGVPVAVKDNIDAAGLPTTAACPAFAYQPAQDSTSVA